MNTYTIKKVSGQPDWSAVPALSMDVCYAGQEHGITAGAQIAYDDEQLYVHLFSNETDLRIEEDGPLASSWLDSCLEFFFAPMEDKPHYINIEMTAKPAMLMAYGPNRYDRMRLIPSQETRGLEPVVNIRDDGWELFYQVPYSLLRILVPDFAPVSGQTMRANCYKCGDKTDHYHLLSWNPVNLKPTGYHTPQDFGMMVFE